MCKLGVDFQGTRVTAEQDFGGRDGDGKPELNRSEVQQRSRRLQNHGATAQGNTNQWASAAPSVLPWIVPAFASLYLKYSLLQGTLSYNSGGFKLASQYVAKEGQGYTVLERLAFFRADILVALLVPLVLFALARYLPSRWRVLIVAVLSAGVTVALYAQLRAFREVGQFLPLRTFLVALSWGWHEPGAYATYLGTKGLLTLLGMNVLIAVVLWWLPKRSENGIRISYGKRTGAVARSIATFCLLLILVVPWLPRVHSTSLHQSVLLRALHAYWYEEEVITVLFSSLGTPELLTRYREFSGGPPAQRNPEYWAKARGSNVLFFVFETLPTRFLAPDDNLDDLPNLRRLRDHSFVAQRHYTTFPRTHEALFSLLSSWYPSDVVRPFEEQHPDMMVPGLMRTLSALGYHTSVYSPMLQRLSLDKEMFQALGVQQVIYPPDALVPPETRQDQRAAWGKRRVARDEATLNLMKQDLERCLTEGQHFAAVFLPQIGHIPYPNVPQNSGEKDLRKQARPVLAMQDAWLGELLQLLERHQQLEQTVIILVGDHGVRTQNEDSSFPPGMIDEYTFHVPLFLYVPQVLNRTVAIPWVTSHIDVAPTVLDLLGIEEGREFEQGAPIWNADLAKRKTYFFANPAFGADGYYSDGRFYMWNHMSDSVYQKLTPHFETSDLVKGKLSLAEVTLSLTRMVALQQVWVTHFDQSKTIRNHLFDRQPKNVRFQTLP